MEGRTRRRLSGIFAGCALALAITAAAAFAQSWAPPGSHPGTFALFKGTPEIQAAGWAVPVAQSHVVLKVRQVIGQVPKPLMEYGFNLGAPMRFYVVSDDYTTFKLYKAAFNTTTGTFSHEYVPQPGKRYYLFADSHPMHTHRQVFRFEFGDASLPAGQPSMTASSTTSAAGPYQVILSKTTIPANQPYLMLVTIDQDGKAAENIFPEYGAAANALLVNVATKQYVFVHPTLRGQKLQKHVAYTAEQEMQKLEANSQSGPNQQFEIPALPAGTYKLWYEFVGSVMQNKFSAPFTIVVQ